MTIDEFLKALKEGRVLIRPHYATTTSIRPSVYSIEIDEE
jgi:hypothetical protein